MPENNDAYQPISFDAIKIGLASPEKILQWSHGEVTKPETINYRTLKPERDGLFCERIFGPSKDWECHCGKYKKIRYKGTVCDRCGVEVTKSSVRRERMGHIKLAAPVSHIWYFKGIPSRMGLIMDIAPRILEKVLYFASYIVLDGGDTPLNYKQVLSEREYRDAIESYGYGSFRAGMGAESILEILSNIDLEKESEELREALVDATGQKRAKIIKRLDVVEAFRSSGNKPEWMILTNVPVIPPDIRPMVQLDGGRFATSDLNDLYRRIINRNNRLARLLELGAPDIIIRNEKRMLQEAVDALIDNGRRGRPVTGPGNRALKSLSDMLKGKQGRFRQNLLGKRVDYSGRSVIVVGPELKIYQCGLPKEMAIELFKPFVMKELVEKGTAHNIKSAKKMVERMQTEVWDILEDVIKEHPVMLNRAPTLHRLGIQAFEPVLVEGKAIKLHPLVCTAFNADFDGDQMAVHLPLSKEAQAEARELMSATANLLKPADGAPVLHISQDIVLGNYYLTYDKPQAQTDKVKTYSSVYEAEMAYDNGVIHLQTPIRIFAKGKMRETTLGRVFFNEILPEDFPYDNNVQTKKQLKKVLAQIFNKYGAEETAKIADRMKGQAFRFATVAAVSTGMTDYVHFEEIPQFVAEGDAKAALISEQFDQGLITEEERYNLTVSAWRNVDNKITAFLKDQLAHMDTSISMMVNSGARGDISNVKLASAMIGVQMDATNHEIELPIRSSYTGGLSSLEAFIATRGARKGLIDTALKTADSGYLTRRLVDVAQDVFTVEDTDGDDEGYAIYRSETEETMIDFSNRLAGRYAAETIPGHVNKNELITREIADSIDDDESIESVKIQSVLSTNNLNGIPQRSYGIDMSTGKLVGNHQPVGVIAAQSVGEPGTQLTLRTFHNSGVAGGDITQGLPRVEELFEARTPKGQAFITEVAGLVDVWEDGKKYIVQITPESGKVERLPLEGRTVVVKAGSSVKAGDVLATGESDTRPLIAPFDGVIESAEDTLVIAAEAASPTRYEIPGNMQLVVKANDVVEAGDRLTTGSLNLHDLMRLKGVEATQRYIINEVLRIYAAQGQDVADKHLEIIVRQMFSRVQIEDAGDSEFVTGDIVSKAAVVNANKQLAAEGKNLISYTQLLLGITKVSIWSDSWLSAASFQDTTRVLINAAVSGRADHLHGLKENVIIGRKIPVGTGAVEESEEFETPSEDEFVEEEVAA